MSQTEPTLIPDGGEKWLMKPDGSVLAPIRGFDAVDEKIDEIRNSKSESSLSLGKVKFSVVDERKGLIKSLVGNPEKSYPERNISARVITIKDHVIIDELENPYESDVDDDGWIINVSGKWIKPIFILDTIEIDSSTYEYESGRLKEITKESEELGSFPKNDKNTTQVHTDQRQAEELTKLEVKIPDGVPSVRDVSVNYDALTDKKPIGGGGNADVSKATLPTPDGDVTLAIKRPRAAGTLRRDAVEQMLDEAETWVKLDDHDHIVGVVDYGSEPLPWIAMEYMDGGHLGDRRGEMELPQALWTSLAVTKGVRHAHRRGVAHLDLKPQNVLLRTVEDAWDVPKVADWGLSKHLLEGSKTVEGMSMAYAAPEQFDEEYGPTDDITDIYQLGAVFYELFTGRPPFEGEPFKLVDTIKSDQPTPPSEIADVPEALDDVILTALAKEKDDRYDDIVYLRDDLQDLFDEW